MPSQAAGTNYPALFVFVSTFVTVFTSLFFISRFLDAKLKEAGYDISDLILIGLDKNENDASRLAGKSTDTSEETTMPYATLLALVLTVATSAFIYWRFSSASTWLHCFTLPRNALRLTISVSPP